MGQVRIFGGKLEKEAKLCFMLRFLQKMPDKDQEERVLRYYFSSGFEHATTLRFLETYHSMNISERTLLRKLDKLNLRRRNTNISIDTVKDHNEEASAGYL